MNISKFSLALLILLFAVIFILWQQDNLQLNSASEERTLATIGDASFTVEVADTHEERMKGLSGRERIGKDEGMLFVFEKAGYHAFWMKDMNFPIDIIWIDEEWRVIDVTKNASPESYPHMFYPSKPARYVLEVNAGEVERNNIHIGSILSQLRE